MTANSTPHCIESMRLNMADTESVFKEFQRAAEEINELVQAVHPEIRIEIVNQVDEVTPYNVDRNKFYFRVTSEDK